jgi:hypothetical protein
MKRPALILILAGVLVSPFPSHLEAEVPATINYRGWLDGYPSSQVTETLIFRLYDSPTSSAPLKELAQTVDIYEGNFSVLLGFAPSDFLGATRYIGVFKADGVTELTNPRPRVVTVPYAYQAGNLHSTTDGKVGIGTTSPQEVLDVAGRIRASEGISFDGTVQTTAAYGDGHSLDAADGSPVNALYVNSSGYVGLGTTNPSERLDIVGNINMTGLLKLPNGKIFNGNSLDAADGSPADVIYVNTSGDVGIGTTTPAAKLGVAGSADISGNVEVTGLLGVGTAPSADNTLFLKRGGTSGTALRDKWAGHIMNRSFSGDEHGLAVTCVGMPGQIALMVGRSDGSTSHNALFYVDGQGNGWLNLDLSVRNLTERSDARLKKDVEDLFDPLDKVMGLRGVSFEWRSGEAGVDSEPDERSLGFIAQEVQQIVPEAVSVDGDGYQCVSYTQLVPVLVEAVKEQQSLIDSQRSEIDLLRDELETLKETVSRHSKEFEEQM